MDTKDLPRSWRPVVIVLVAIGAVVSTTVGVTAWAASGASKAAQAQVAPVQADLDAYKSLEAERRKTILDQLELIRDEQGKQREKLDLLLQRTPR